MFSKNQTLFLIQLMEIHLLVEAEGPEKSMRDLNRRMWMGKQTKKLWEEMAEKLSTQFQEDFQQDKVAQKWATLVDGFYPEMESVLVRNHAVASPVVEGDERRLVILRPDALRRPNRAPSAASKDRAPPAAPSTSTASSAPPRALPHQCPPPAPLPRLLLLPC